MRLNRIFLALFVLLSIFLVSSCTDSSESNDGESTVDTDGDGLTDTEEKNIYHTNPGVLDTDGDGYSDYEEVINKAFDSNTDNYEFNPLIADVPKLDVRLSSTPDFSMNYTTTNGTSTSTGTERSTSNSEANTKSWGGSQSHSIEMSHSAGVELGVEHEFGLFGGTKVNAKLKYEFSHSETNTSSSEWSSGQTTENTTALSNMETVQNDTSNTINGGSISTSIIISNMGDLAYVLEGLALSAFIKNSSDPFDVKAIATLTTDFPVSTLTAGEATPPLIFTNSSLGIDTVKSLLKNSTNLIFEPVVGTLSGVDNFNFELASTNINARTAQVIVDFGLNQPVEYYRVATIQDTNNPGITAEYALTNILKIPYSLGIGSWTFGTESSSRDSFTGLTQVRNTVMDASANRYWIVSHTYNINNGADRATDYHNLILADYDFNAIELNKGDVLHLVLIEDTDRDGLGNRSEFLYKTDPTKVDTDGDTLSDSLEVSGWTITHNGVPDTRVYSDPTKLDSDGDGSNDAVEKLEGTHPNFLDNTPPSVDTLTVTMDGFDASMDITVSDPESTVVSITIDWGDSSTDVLTAGAPFTTLSSITHSYATHGDYTISVTAKDSNNAISNAKTALVTATVPTNGLIFHLTMDATINDELGHPTFGTGSGPSISGFTDTDRHGFGNKALFLRDSNDSQGFAHVIYAVNLNQNPPTEGMTGSYSMAIWVKVPLTSQSEYIMGQHGFQQLYFTNSGSIVAFGSPPTNLSTTPLSAVSSIGTTLNTWTFYVGVAEIQGADTLLTLYKDGIVVGTHTLIASNNSNPNACDVFVGNMGDGQCYGVNTFTEFYGYDLSVDDARIYNRALTASEVNSLYHEGGF